MQPGETAMREIAPAHLKCGFGDCPAFYEDVDGRLFIRAPLVSFEERRDIGLPASNAPEDYVRVSSKYKGALRDALNRG